MSVTIKHRGDTAANWTAANPVLALREMGLELDTQRFKVGDGVTAWNSLGYWGDTITTDAINSSSGNGIAVADDLDLAAGVDLFPRGNDYGIGARAIDYGFTPDEHWTGGSDDIAWTGWASYTGYATPGIISTSNSIYRVANAGATKAFRYRAAATGNFIFLRCRMSLTQVCSAGLMLDDGTDTGDGEGANNFYRIYITQATLGGPVNLVEQYRTGGGGVTTNTTTGAVPLAAFIGLELATQGTIWTSWAARPRYFGESGEFVQYTSGSPHTWTPARVGIYWVGTLVSGAVKGLWDWYDEATA